MLALTIGSRRTRDPRSDHISLKPIRYEGRLADLVAEAAYLDASFLCSC